MKPAGKEYQCVRALGIVKDTAWRDITDLIEKGFLTKEGGGNSVRYLLNLLPETSENRTEIGRRNDNADQSPAT